MRVTDAAQSYATNAQQKPSQPIVYTRYVHQRELQHNVYMLLLLRKLSRI